MPAFNLQLRQVQAFVALVENLKRYRGIAGSGSCAIDSFRGNRRPGARTRHCADCPECGTHTVALTPAGKALLPHAREVLSAVEKTYAAAAEAAVSARGIVNIIANESVSTYVLSQVLMTIRGRWRTRYLGVSVAGCPAGRGGDSVRSGAFDLGTAPRHPPIGSRSPRLVRQTANGPRASIWSLHSYRSSCLRLLPILSRGLTAGRRCGSIGTRSVSCIR